MELEPLSMTTFQQVNVGNNMKIFFTFDFHILREQRISGRIFPSLYFNEKNRFSMRSVLIHLLTIETVSKLLHCGRKSQNYIHIDNIIANQNWYHDDKSTL